MSELDQQIAAQLAEATARQSYGRLLAILSARSGDVARAEDALSTAFESALLTWPERGVPAQAEAWLLTTARRALIDDVRRQQKHNALMHELLILADEFSEEFDASAIPDQRLALMFACAHPALDASVHAPLILQTILGLDAASIASAFLQSPSSMAQKLVRAKAKIRDSRIPFVLPDQSAIPARLDAVLAAVYSAYSNGWSDIEQSHNLTDEALWLGHLLTQLAPEEPEALGLCALMLYLEARRPARRKANGEYVPLSEQDCSLWHGGMLRAAEKLLKQAASMQRPGRYQLEAAIQSAHMVRRYQLKVDWSAIVHLYAQLMQLSASPVVRINHAIALAETAGPHAALAQLLELENDKRLQDYQPYWAARAHLYARTGQPAQAEHAYLRAIGLTSDAAVRQFLQTQCAACTEK